MDADQIDRLSDAALAREIRAIETGARPEATAADYADLISRAVDRFLSLTDTRERQMAAIRDLAGDN